MHVVCKKKVYKILPQKTDDMFVSKLIAEIIQAGLWIFEIGTVTI